MSLTCFDKKHWWDEINKFDGCRYDNNDIFEDRKKGNGGDDVGVCVGVDFDTTWRRVVDIFVLPLNKKNVLMRHFVDFFQTGRKAPWKKS